MQPYYGEPARPPALTAIAVVSLIWSGFTIIRVVVLTVIGLVLGVSGWMFGPGAGAVTSFVGATIIVITILGSLLSIVLFLAAWHTFLGDPAGRDLHRLWAWCNLVLELLGLVFNWGLSPKSWFGLIYSGIVLYVTDLPEVRAYFNRRAVPWPPHKPSGIADDTL